VTLLDRVLLSRADEQTQRVRMLVEVRKADVPANKGGRPRVNPPLCHCGRAGYARGLCHNHYAQLRRAERRGE
jgi:hypothetical protein